MKYFRCELRQIFSLRFLLFLAAALACLTYFLIVGVNDSYQLFSLDFSSSPVSRFSSNTDIELLLTDTVMKDGRTAATQEDIDALSQRVLKEFNQTELEEYFKNSKELHALGISSLQDYRDLSHSIQEMQRNFQDSGPVWEELYLKNDQIYALLNDSWVLEELQSLLWVESILDQIQDSFDHRHTLTDYEKSNYDEYTESEKARLKEILSGPMDSVSNSSLKEFLQRGIFTPYVMFSASLSCIFLLTYIWRSRSRRVNLLQYTSRAGRKILSAQMFAGAAVALLFHLAGLIPVFILLARCGFFQYFGLPLSGFLARQNYLWFDLSIGAYFFLILLLTVCLGVGLSLLSLCISRLCRNFVACVACTLPLLVVSFLVAERIFNASFSLTSPKLAETFCTAAVLLPAILAAWFLCRREKKIDIV